MALPAGRADGEVAHCEPGIGGCDHLAHGFTGHYLADLDRLGVGLLLAQPAAHVGVDRQPDRAGDDLAGTRGWDRVLDDVEVGPIGGAGRTAAQHNRATDGVGGHGGVSSGGWVVVHLRRALWERRAQGQAASARSTSRPVTLPSFRRISAAYASRCGTVATGNAGNVPSCASFTSSRSSLGLPT